MSDETEEDRGREYERAERESREAYQETEEYMREQWELK